jgi:hypothetical protein
MNRIWFKDGIVSVALLIGLNVFADSSKNYLKGYLILENGQTFFTEKYHSTAPTYHVEWHVKNGESFCPINRIPSCRPVIISFQKKYIGPKEHPQLVLSDATIKVE